MTRFIKKYWQVALLGMLFAVILYSMLMTQQLTNTYDGLWSQNYRHAGVAELTSGRWMLYFIDKLDMGLHADPIASIATLCLFTAGFLLLLDLFGVKKKSVGFLCLALFLSSTVICCTLSYRMTSLGYGFSYLFAALGLYAAIKIRRPAAAVCLGGVSLGLSLACYQTYLAVFCVAAAFYLIYLCHTAARKDAAGKSPVLSALFRILGSGLFALIFYAVALFILLKLAHAALSDYNGAGSITPAGLILGLPKNIWKTFRYFGVYFLTNTSIINRLQYFGGHCVLLALLAALVGVVGFKAWKTSKPRLAVVLLAALAIPVACSAYMLIAGDKLELQMTAGLAMLMPLTMLLAFTCLPAKRMLQLACTVFCAALLYGNSMQVWFDQEAMYEGRNASTTMAAQVLSDLKSQDLLSDEYEYYFIGVPARNPHFSVSEAYACANGYAQMGNFWGSGNCGQMSYAGLINKRMGFQLPMSYRSYEQVCALYDTLQMPCFPDDGYLQLIDDHLVIVKISEYAAYSEYR